MYNFLLSFWYVAKCNIPKKKKLKIIIYNSKLMASTFLMVSLY